MCNYLGGHSMLDGNQYAFVGLCQGYLISFYSRWRDDIVHVNKKEERDTIAQAKLAILSNKTGRHSILELMSRETMTCEGIEPKATDCQRLSQCQPGDDEGSGRLRQGGGTRRAPGLAWLLLANRSPTPLNWEMLIKYTDDPLNEGMSTWRRVI